MHILCSQGTYQKRKEKAREKEKHRRNYKMKVYDRRWER